MLKLSADGHLVVFAFIFADAFAPRARVAILVGLGTSRTTPEYGGRITRLPTHELLVIAHLVLAAWAVHDSTSALTARWNELSTTMRIHPDSQSGAAAKGSVPPHRRS